MLLKGDAMNNIFYTFAPFVSVAQLVEQLTLNQRVESSSLSGDTQRINERLAV
jgi:hypothetical protein